MSELSIFVDESGNFGSYVPSIPYYLFTMVFHDQANDINPQIRDLETFLFSQGLNFPTIHTRPLLRHEGLYKTLNIKQQRCLFSRLYIFAKKCGLRYKVFSFDRKTCREGSELQTQISKQLETFVRDYYELFLGHERTILYYDDGQRPLSNALTSVLDRNVAGLDHRHIEPSDYQQYRLAQVADLACCLELSKLLYDNGNPTNSERLVFGSAKQFKKRYYEGFAEKQL